MLNIFIFLLVMTSGAFAQSKATKNLFKSIEKNDLILAQNSIKMGADINGVDSVKSPTTTVLLKALELKRYDIVKLLLNQNADVNQRRPSDFYTGLMMASEKNDAKMASMLLSHGADVNLDTTEGLVSLQIAAQKNSVEVGQLLLKSKEIDVNVGGENCALSHAAKSGSVGMILLLKKQIGSRASSPFCIEKALNLAKTSGHDEIVRILKRN